MKNQEQIQPSIGRVVAAGVATALSLALLPVASGQAISRPQTFTENRALNDGTGLGNEFIHGLTFFSDYPGATLTSLTVELNLTGGFNGQLFAYLANDTGYCVLLNRVGRDAGNLGGFIDPGMNVTFSDTAPNGDVHIYASHDLSSPLTGLWASDGRETDPGTVVTGDLRSGLLSSFANGAADGTWTLYVEDLVPGQQATLHSWTLNLTGIPEPGTGLLFGLGVCGVAVHALRRRR